MMNETKHTQSSRREFTLGNRLWPLAISEIPSSAMLSMFGFLITVVAGEKFK